MVTLNSISGTTITLEVKVDISGSMLEAEEKIQLALNEAGTVITGEALKRFDTDGSAIMTGPIKWSTKGALPRIYQTPYGQTEIKRHVYQTGKGGKTFCPLEQDARIIVSATPRFAKMVSNKIANNAITTVQVDLEENHGRHCSRSLITGIIDVVGALAQAKEESWDYEVPALDKEIANIAIGVDGTCMFISQDGWREAMTGTVALYDKKGERQHTIYIGATPEYGKATFFNRMEKEIARTKKLYPKADYVGLADGAKTNWNFLEKHTTIHILDFWHVTQYLAQVAEAVYPESEKERTAWLDERCHNLKHNKGAADVILDEIEALSQHALSRVNQEKIDGAITYFRNHKHQMDYPLYQSQGLPIGSGVTEASCKTLIKHRLCASGMKWKDHGAGIVLSLRALVLTTKRWSQFWNKIDQFGCSFA